MVIQKKIAVIVFITFPLVSKALLFADLQERVITEYNNYKGRTIEVIYDEGDTNYLSNDGIKRLVIYFDNDGQVRQQEQIYLKHFAEKIGHVKVIVYFDTNGNPLKEEVYCSQSFSRDSGLLLEVSYFNEEGKIYRSELYFDKKYELKEGYDQLAIENNIGYAYKQNKLIITIENILDVLKDKPGMKEYKF